MNKRAKVVVVVLAFGLFVACMTQVDPGSIGTVVADSVRSGDTTDRTGSVAVGGVAAAETGRAVLVRQIGHPLFFDGFDYEVGREDADALARFRKQGGWQHGKTQQDRNSRYPRGYLYTTISIPGYQGRLPGLDSSHVLAIEALPTKLGNPHTGNWGDMQTDFYLQYGTEGAPTDTIPADVWFRFWIYPTGRFDRGMKLIYPCRSHYPCTDGQWLVTLGSTSQEPYWEEFSRQGEPVPDIFLQFYAVDAKYLPSTAGADGNDLGQTNTSVYLRNGRWSLVTIHIDTTGPQGIYEAWLRPLGGKEVKVAEFIGGKTRNFIWPIRDNRGHSQFRIPTTVGGPRALQLYPESYDSTLYIDDFAMAATREALPVYP